MAVEANPASGSAIMDNIENHVQMGLVAGPTLRINRKNTKRKAGRALTKRRKLAPLEIA